MAQKVKIDGTSVLTLLPLQFISYFREFLVSDSIFSVYTSKEEKYTTTHRPWDIARLESKLGKMRSGPM